MNINEIILELNGIVNKKHIETIVVIPDLMHAIPLIGNTKLETLNLHIELLKNSFNCPIWMPTFSYSTVENHFYDSSLTKSEIGILNEHFRLHNASWRSPHPIYNFAGTGDMPNVVLNDIIYPYDETSMFHHMNKEGYFILSYGSRYGTQSRYMLNYIETLANVPYRKDVFVDMTILDNNMLTHHKACYRVIPQVNELYKMEHYRNNIYNELIDNSIAKSINSDLLYLDIINIPYMIEYFYNKLICQPLYLLDTEYQKWLINNHLI